jgi:hypothetical protein
MTTGNPYCDALGIEVPRLEAAARSADANYYSLLIVALLERGGPITLEEAARRFEAAGIAPAPWALHSLKRSKPGRPPIYRDGDLYALDPYSEETDLWAFRLGLRPPAAPPPKPVRGAEGPLPSPDEPLTVVALEEAWREGVPPGWSALRVAICVLDAHQGPMRAEEVLAFVSARTRWSMLSAESAQYWRRGAAVRVREDGLWELDPGHEAVRAARAAAVERIALVRRWAGLRVTPEAVEESAKRYERKRDANAERLARLSRVLIHAFPADSPWAVVLVDVGSREIATFEGEAVAAAGKRLARYDLLAAVGVRPLLRALGFDPGLRRLAELGPPQKTWQLNRRGRTLRITTRLLIQGSCGISRPLADEAVLRRYLRDGEVSKLRRRLEADAKSLFAYYQYGRLHGTVRLRWGFVDDMLPAPWVHRDERTLYDLVRRARESGAALEVVIAGAPGWAEPWSRARRVYIPEDQVPGRRMWLVGEDGYRIDMADVQLARLAGEDRAMP